MKTIVSIAKAASIAALLLTLAPDAIAAQQPAANAGPASRTGARGPDATAPMDATGAEEQRDPAEEVPVLYVTSLEVLRTTIEPKVAIIRVTGMTSSQGWGEPTLVPTSPAGSAGTVLDLELIAMPPADPRRADGFQAVDAVLVLDSGDPYTAFRVRGRANGLQLDAASGATSTQIHVADCAECIGKRLATSAGPAHETVDGKELPGGTRILGPTDGTESSVVDQNRLTLIVDGQGTVTDAYWE